MNEHDGDDPFPQFRNSDIRVRNDVEWNAGVFDGYVVIPKEDFAACVASGSSKVFDETGLLVVSSDDIVNPSSALNLREDRAGLMVAVSNGNKIVAVKQFSSEWASWVDLLLKAAISPDDYRS